MAAKPEIVHSAEVIDFDKPHAAAVLRRLDSAMQGWVRSTVELADLAYEARSAECWRVDEAFLDARASGSIDPDLSGNVSRSWLGWKFNRAGRNVEQLADYGELRAIIAGDPTLPPLAEPEGAARPLGKLLHPRYLSSEAKDAAAHHDAIRAVWRDALKMTESGSNPAEAVKLVPKALKRCEYQPLRRIASKSEKQKSIERQEAIKKAGKAMATGGYDLLRFGALDVFDQVMAELTEARRRV